ncbi:hypothetical protein B0A48_05691 [Cryoendolithus antarcticus]|uniref:Major facilitator superfamily (MFS) profile domain-containing protein n=1 Tax=Cryoendolithus antarcticus TaxID=1507870 RepID=A0A1V8TC24_9PEZI|nr:hypothetical protein B0A48_05691 [Cryoendolithus antarcticus]
MGKDDSGSSHGSGNHADEKHIDLDSHIEERFPDPDAGKSEAERAAIDKALVRRLDFKLIPWLTLLYLVSFLDR